MAWYFPRPLSSQPPSMPCDGERVRCISRRKVALEQMPDVGPQARLILDRLARWQVVGLPYFRMWSPGPPVPLVYNIVGSS